MRQDNVSNFATRQEYRKENRHKIMRQEYLERNAKIGGKGYYRISEEKRKQIRAEAMSGKLCWWFPELKK